MLTSLLVLISCVAPITGAEVKKFDFSDLPPAVKTVRLTDFFTEIQRESAVPIRFLRADLSLANLAGQTSFFPTETIVRYSVTSDVELENLLAHELGHVFLHVKGLSMDVRTSGLNDEFLNAIRDDISSAVEDYLIVKIMLKRGFRPQLVWENLANNLLNPQYIPPNIVAGDGFQRFAGLRLFCVLNQRGLFGNEVTITREQLEKAAIALQPNIVQHERNYQADVGTLDCNDAQSCFVKTKKLRDAVGFPSVTVRNPKTGIFE
ncbi:MAG: hypothetical protein JWQ87_5228 [Candidatus Sulfotelmatobacter sp.]|nr:hypothetical protein [Candidatus Sulfotelmatobacter sp.]